MRKAKTALCLITATGLTFHAFNPNFLSSSSDSFPNFPEKLRAPIHGVNRSSRAIATVRFLPFHSPFLSFKKKKNLPFPSISFTVNNMFLKVADCFHCCWLQVHFTWTLGWLWWVSSEVIWGWLLGCFSFLSYYEVWYESLNFLRNVSFFQKKLDRFCNCLLLVWEPLWRSFSCISFEYDDEI